MNGKGGEKDLLKRIRTGEIRQQDVTRMLAELAYGRVNDCVRLALEEHPCLDELDLRLLSGVKRNDNGTVEIRLIDRLQVLRQLAEAAQGNPSEMGQFLQALQGGEEP